MTFLVGLIANPWRTLAVALLIGIGPVWLHGAATGGKLADDRQLREAARLQAELDALNNEFDRAEVKRLQAEQEAARLAEELEDAARQDDNADRIAIGTDSVRRLNAR